VAKFTDQQIIEGLLKGEDDKILEYLYDAVLPGVKKMVYKYKGTDDQAYDVFQDAILKFYSYVKQGKFQDASNIKGFIYTISRNLYIDFLRRQGKSRSIEEINAGAIASTDSPLERIITNEKEAKVLEFFSRMGETCKNVLIYYFYYNMSMKEISEKMNFSSEDVAKTKKFKCKEKLLQLVKKDPSLNTLIRYE